MNRTSEVVVRLAGSVLCVELVLCQPGPGSLPGAGARGPAAVRASLDGARFAQSEWRHVERLPVDTEIVVTADGRAATAGRMAAADANGLTFVPAGAPSIFIARDTVIEVQRRRRSGGSKAGAIIGAAGGAGLGLLSAFRLSYKDCGGGCGSERFLMGVSIVGLPVAGAWIGYRVGGKSDRLETIYRRPARHDRRPASTLRPLVS